MATAAYFTPLILLATAIFVLYLFYKKQFNYWKRKNIYFIKPVPVIGNFLPVLLLKQSIGPWLWDLYNQTTGKDYFGIYVFDKPFLAIRSPELLNSIFIKEAQSFQTRERTIAKNDEFIQNILFLSSSSRWKHLRKQVTSVFTSGKLTLMYPLLVKESQDLVNYLKTKAPVESINLEEVFAKFSTNCIARCAFGVEANCFGREDAEFRVLGREMFEFRPSLAFRQTATFFLPAFVKLFGIKFWPDETINKIKSIFNSVLKVRSEMKTLKGNDLVDMMLELKEKDNSITDSEILSQAVQFFGAGFETTAGTLGFSLYELAQNSDIQDKLRTEIQEKIENNNGECSLEALTDMKYLDMVVCEVLRKYPPVALMDRKCNENYKVPNTDFVIEKNTPVLISTMGFHYDEKYFPNPHKFDPERFSDKYSVNANGSIYYFPFGAGPRNCLGARFGRIVVKLGIVHVLSKFMISRAKNTPAEIQFEPTCFVLHSNVGIPLKVENL